MTKIILIITMILTFFSCSYHWKRYETIDGKKIWLKSYKDHKESEIKSEQAIFRYGDKEQTYSKYKGKISSDTIDGSPFVQFDSVRVYMFSKTDTFKSIFLTGLVYGQMLYCSLDSLCRPPKEYNFTAKPKYLESWDGYTFAIYHFELLNNVKSKPTQRRFKFYGIPNKIHMNGYYVFFLELTNDRANSSTNLEAFITGARVTFIKSPWVMI